jgi:class 3 adenylate cyclase
MDAHNDRRAPQSADFLVAFFDLTGFSRFARGRSDQEVFAVLSEYYELIGDIVEGPGGRVVKFMGDAGLIVFPAEKADDGVLALRELQRRGDRWLADRDSPCRHVIKIHFGEVVCGEVGTRGEKRFDVFGMAVNTAALLKSNGFAMTSQAFRKLAPDTRKLFKKHTPPITYIPVEESHRD